jgi:hypothetical protein
VIQPTEEDARATTKGFKDSNARAYDHTPVPVVSGRLSGKVCVITGTSGAMASMRACHLTDPADCRALELALSGILVW